MSDVSVPVLSKTTTSTSAAAWRHDVDEDDEDVDEDEDDEDVDKDVETDASDLSCVAQDCRTQCRSRGRVVGTEHVKIRTSWDRVRNGERRRRRRTGGFFVVVDDENVENDGGWRR